MTVLAEDRIGTLSIASVRAMTDALAAPLSAEDQTVQSMPDVSPTKWHRAHTTWFFETFVLMAHLDGYEVFDEQFAFLFNSYYESLGSRHPRVERGLLTRPGAERIGDYRRHVDRALAELSERGVDARVAELLEVGLHHEQQHQELICMDITHVLSTHPFDAPYRPSTAPRATTASDVAPIRWMGHDRGVRSIGHPAATGGSRSGFAFDNEGPRHDALVHPFEIADRLVTCGEWCEFIEDGGYRRPELWMSDGWAQVGAQGWEAPLYWRRDDGWTVFDMTGRHQVEHSRPVANISWFEADAYARWCGARLPTEAEWEVAAPEPAPGAHLDLEVLTTHAAADSPDPGQWFGELWQWTGSPYRPYPGFRPAPGALGEYNGKFMVNQHVLRGSSFATPPGHARRTYRNFFPPHTRWQFSGLRLARDAG